METQVEFTTSDGVTLAGDLHVPDGAVAAAIVCHPHPQYGGNRFNPVVEALHQKLPTVGVASLRFDFRTAFDNGVGEVLDAQGALDELRRQAPGAATFATGYSFGAMMTLGLNDADLTGKVLVAPPLGHIDASNEPTGAVLVFSPAHDQFAPPDVARPIVEAWPHAEFEVVESVDHFLAGRAAHVADRAASWITARLTP